MKHCNNCRVDINTDSKICPLCNSRLSGDCKPVFPALNKKKQELLLGIIFLISIIVIAFDMYVDYMNDGKISYSLFIFIGVGIFYAFLRYLISSVYKNPLTVFYIFLFVLDAIIYVSLYYTKVLMLRNIIPIIVLTNVILSSFLAISFRDTHIRKYMQVMILDLAFMMCSIGLIIINIIGNQLLLNASIIVSIIIVIGLFIYNIKNIKEELIKVFYI